MLATLLTPIERAFGGLDRVAVWHRRAAVAGVVLLIPHVALVSSAQDRYATSFGHVLGDIALLGLLVLAVWALAPSLRTARWPGPMQRMARATFEHWLTGHRLTGLFVVIAVGHGAIVDPVSSPFGASTRCIPIDGSSSMYVDRAAPNRQTRCLTG